MSVIKNKRTKQKVANTMQTQGPPITSADVETKIDDAIEELTDSGALLPEVTTADNGKLMTVSAGAVTTGFLTLDAYLKIGESAAYTAYASQNKSGVTSETFTIEVPLDKSYSYGGNFNCIVRFRSMQGGTFEAKYIFKKIGGTGEFCFKLFEYGNISSSALTVDSIETNQTNPSVNATKMLVTFTTTSNGIYRADIYI